MSRKPKPKLYLRFKTPEGKQSPYCPAVYDSKSRIRNFWCLVNGVPESHPNGYYYQRVKRDGKEKWESLGTDPHAAHCTSLAQAKKEAHGTEDVLGLKANQPEQPAPADKAPGYRLADEVREYLINAAKLAAKTYKAYKKSLELFQESCKKTYVHQIGKQDLQAFDTLLLQRGNDDRTRSNRVGHIVTFLRNEQGRRPGPPITDVTITIKYVESPPEAYRFLVSREVSSIRIQSKGRGRFFASASNLLRPSRVARAAPEIPLSLKAKSGRKTLFSSIAKSRQLRT